MTEFTKELLDELRSRDYRSLRRDGEEKPILYPTDLFGFNLGAPRREKSLEGNLSPNFEKVINLGFLGLREELLASLAHAENDERRAYGEEMLRVLDTALADADEFREKVRAAGNSRLAAALERVPYRAAESFYEACVFIKACIYFLRRSRASHLGLGRFDIYMYPFFKRDIERGVTREELFETLECFFISLNFDSDQYPGVQQGDNGQSLMLGGFSPDGASMYNELSELCIRASLELSLIDPKINLRVGKNTPDEIFLLATELTKQGLGFPQYSNDDVVVDGLISLGYDACDAYNYSVAACWEFIVPNCSADVPNAATMNFPLVVSRAVRAHLEQSESFEELFSYVKEEIDDECAALVAEKNKREFPPMPMLSLFIDGCIEKLRDLHHGGAKYMNFGCHGAGIANAADALAAIKKLIFDEKSLEKRELLSALDADFEGYSVLRARLRSCPKMGENDDLVDGIASMLMDAFSESMNGRPNRNGGIWRAGTGSAMEYVLSAEKCPATADGRRAGEPYSSSFSPSLDVRPTGLLSVISSFTKYDMRKIINGGPLTVELHDTVLRNKIGIEKTAAFVKSFICLGGHQLQLNSINRERLLEAQRHPEEHKNLIVRVWGWSGYFCELDTKYQEHIIRRTEYLS